MHLTFREKSLGLLLLSLVATFGIYFASVLPTQSTQIAPSHVMAFLGMLIVLVVLQIVGHTILAITSRRELSAAVQSDESDALISLKATRLGSYVLATGVFCALCMAVLIPGNFAFAHVLLAFWVLAQATETISQLVFYRRGA